MSLVVGPIRLRQIMNPQSKVRLLLTFVLGTYPALATELYNLDFTSPETGTYQTVFGNPRVQASVGPFADALVLQAVTTYDQIRLRVENTAPRYDIQCDVLMHDLLNSQYLFSIFLDFDPVPNRFQSVNFHGGGNRIDTFPSAQFFSEGFANDRVYHFGISLDFQAIQWTLAIDGSERFTSPLNGSGLQFIRFSMAPWIGGAEDGPGIYAAIDNIVVTAVPEPSVFLLSALGAFLAAILLLKQNRMAQCRRGGGSLTIR